MVLASPASFWNRSSIVAAYSSSSGTSATVDDSRASTVSIGKAACAVPRRSASVACTEATASASRLGPHAQGAPLVTVPGRQLVGAEQPGNMRVTGARQHAVQFDVGVDAAA